MHSYAREVVDEAKASLDCHGLDATPSVTTLVLHGLTNSRARLIDNAEKESLPYYLDVLEPQDKSLSADDRKNYMMARRTVMYNSDDIHTYFLHGHEDGLLVIFSHCGLKAVHTKQWYLDESSPLYDETLRPLLTTTTTPMLSMSAVGVMGAIDRYVEGRLSKSANVLRFTGKVYADKQHAIRRSMDIALETDIHRETMKVYLQDLHNSGMRALNDKLGLTSPTLIYIPTSLEELTQPPEPENPTTSRDAIPDSDWHQNQQTSSGSFPTWPSTALYPQAAPVPDSDGSALSLYSDVNFQPLYASHQSASLTRMHVPPTEESYLNLSANSTYGLSAEEGAQDAFWSVPYRTM